MLFSMMTFAIAALVLIMMPGPDLALITGNSLRGGRRGGLLTVLGGVPVGAAYRPRAGGRRGGRGAAAVVGVPAPGVPVERAQPEGRAVLRHLPAPVPLARQRFGAGRGPDHVRDLRGALRDLVRPVRRRRRAARPLAAAPVGEGTHRAAHRAGAGHRRRPAGRGRPLSFTGD